VDLLAKVAGTRDAYRERKALVGLTPIADGTQGTFYVPAFPGAGAQLRRDGELYPDGTFANYASQGYGRNELVYACIRERAENLPQSTLRVYPAGGGEPLDDDRLRQLIENPNPVTSEFEFWELLVTYLDLGGMAPILIQRAIDGKPSELWPLRPDLIRIFPTNDPRVWDYGYVLDPSASPSQQNTETIPIRRGDLIMVKYPNPGGDPHFGQPPLRPAARAVSLDNAATDFVDTLLRNYAVPGVAIQTVEAVDQGVADRLKRKWKQAFSGANRGDPAVLQQGMTVQPLGLNLNDLEFPELRSYSESHICAALSVPPILVGAKVGLDRSTFTNYGEARKQLWEEGIFSLQRRFGDPIRSSLLPEFQGVGQRRKRLRWDNSEVLALQDDTTAKWNRATNALARGAITINDFRLEVGLSPVPAGNVFLMPAGVIQQLADGTAPASNQATPVDQPGPAAAEAASYAEQFLAELSRGRPRELVAVK
jgi:HK97 family phage portal protein